MSIKLEMEHTPGPWAISEFATQNGAPIIRAGTCWRKQPRDIAKVVYHAGSEDPEVTANAHLIVTAPELLEACEAAIPCLEDWVITTGFGETNRRDRAALVVLKQAVAKAKGLV